MHWFQGLPRDLADPLRILLPSATSDRAHCLQEDGLQHCLFRARCRQEDGLAEGADNKLLPPGSVSFRPSREQRRSPAVIRASNTGSDSEHLSTDSDLPQQKQPFKDSFRGAPVSMADSAQGGTRSPPAVPSPPPPPAPAGPTLRAIRARRMRVRPRHAFVWNSFGIAASLWA